jgi:4-alpha-glucanotransferase
MARFQRASGVLLHPTSLPGAYGIGTLGAQALAFIDWLAAAEQSYWQICPLVPTGYGDSPYQGFSAFAGNPNLIDLDELVESGLLSREDLRSLSVLPDAYVDFGRLIPGRTEVLRRGWTRFSAGQKSGYSMDEFDSFRRSAAYWLDDFCMFMVLKNIHHGISWDQWDDRFRLRDNAALESARRNNIDEIGFHGFLQFLFHCQWRTVKTAAGDRGIRIIGDLPIFISFDSSDCWARPELFQLDENRRPTGVAGVPPDYFSATGQLWGNPLYNWDRMSSDGFSWWISVLQDKLKAYDVLRIDHFRGFAAYWSVPFGESTAVNGEWVPAPGRELFGKVRDTLGDLPIIAEDLGVITEDVVALIEECGYPGMKVLQFAFDSSEQNDYLPHNFDKHSVVYTGTHDNDTSAGWFESASRPDRKIAAEYLNIPVESDGKTAASAMLRAAMASVSDLVVIPLQDILGLDSSARFNTPGTLGGNWKWRTAPGTPDEGSALLLRKLTRIYGRTGRNQNV